MDHSLLQRVDHLVYSTADLEKSIADLEGRLGARAAPGGQHPGRGTRNALLALSESSYLEIVGPDTSLAWNLCGFEGQPEFEAVDLGAATSWSMLSKEIHSASLNAYPKRLLSNRVPGM